MTTLNDRFEKGQEMRSRMAAGDPAHFTLPGIDHMAPDLKRIVDEALFGSIWSRPGLDIKLRCVSTISALMALGQLPLLRRHIERGLNVGLTPDQIVEVFIQMAFYTGIPSVETALRMASVVFVERGIEFTPTRVYDTNQSVEDLHALGHKTHEEHIGDISTYYTEDADSEEMQLEALINEYNWGAIYTRPHLDAKTRSLCSLSAMTVMGQYDRQLRRRIEGSLRVGMTQSEIMELFMHLTLYGGYFNVRTAMRIARSVFTEMQTSA